MKKEKFIEEITEFPEQDTFNCDDMIIEQTEDENHGLCNADR